MGEAPLRPEQYDRYKRHLILPEIGLAGQHHPAGAQILAGTERRA